MISEAVEAHYVKTLGQPSRRATFSITGEQVEVLKWKADANPEGVALYASIGGSSAPVNTRENKHRMELFAGFLPENDDFAKVLGMLALDGITHRSKLGHGHIVSYPEPLWAGTEMRSVVVLRPLEEIFPPLVLGDGSHVEFMQVIPLYEAEQAFRRQAGVEALIQSWQAEGVEFWNPLRPQARPSTP